MVFALAAGLSACDRLTGATDEYRINAAVAVSAEAREARQALDELGGRLSVDIGKIANEYRDRLKIRALECAHGYSPSLLDSEEKIRAALTDTECFRRFDESLAQWINTRRIGLLLTAPPLRPIPEQPAANLPADGNIVEASFAAKAGVAILQTKKGFQVLDLGTGATIRSVEQTESGLIGAPSPNGRLLVFATKSGDWVVIEAESGAPLMRFAKIRASRFFWVADAGVILRCDDRKEPVFLDLTNGTETRIPVNMPTMSLVVATPMDGRYALLDDKRIEVVDIMATPQGWTVKLVSEADPDSGAIWSSISGETADGAIYYYGDSQNNAGKSAEGEKGGGMKARPGRSEQGARGIAAWVRRYFMVNPTPV
jgi:hypothetical protein